MKVTDRIIDLIKYNHKINFGGKLWAGQNMMRITERLWRKDGIIVAIVYQLIQTAIPAQQLQMRVFINQTNRINQHRTL